MAQQKKSVMELVELSQRAEWIQLDLSLWTISDFLLKLGSPDLGKQKVHFSIEQLLLNPSHNPQPTLWNLSSSVIFEL